MLSIFPDKVQWNPHKYEDEEIKQKLIKSINSVSPSLSAVIKDSQIKCSDEQVIIYVSSKFLKDTLNKTNTYNLIKTHLDKIGFNISVICEVNPNLVSAKQEVAEVFDII